MPTSLGAARSLDLGVSASGGGGVQQITAAAPWQQRLWRQPPAPFPALAEWRRQVGSGARILTVQAAAVAAAAIPLGSGFGGAGVALALARRLR